MQTIKEELEARGWAQDDLAEMRANARLISAAPDMYEALKVLERWATEKLEYNQEVAEHYVFISNARKSLAKAEGRK